MPYTAFIAGLLIGYAIGAVSIVLILSLVAQAANVKDKPKREDTKPVAREMPRPLRFPQRISRINTGRN